jgi:hypothetical protein
MNHSGVIVTPQLYDSTYAKMVNQIDRFLIVSSFVSDGAYAISHGWGHGAVKR